MNNVIVLQAIEDKMDFLFNKVWCNPKNENKDLSKVQDDIKDLYEAYIEIRGHAGAVSGAGLLDTRGFNNVDSIYELTRG